MSNAQSPYSSNREAVKHGRTTLATGPASNVKPGFVNSNYRESDLPMHYEEGRRDIVYVVDDEPAIARTAALILSGGGFDARPFTDPVAALKAARIEAPNLLLSDVIMPGLNGFELSTEVVEGCPECKVLLFSGNPSARETYAATPTEKGWEVLIKPIAPVDLLQAIRTKLDV